MCNSSEMPMPKPKVGGEEIGSTSLMGSSTAALQRVWVQEGQQFGARIHSHTPGQGCRLNLQGTRKAGPRMGTGDHLSASPRGPASFRTPESLLHLKATLAVSSPIGAAGVHPPWNVPSQDGEPSKGTLLAVTDKNLNLFPSYLLSSQEAD